MTSWSILPSKNWKLHTHPHLWWQIFAHFLPEILTKHNIKETASKGSIGGPFYLTKGEGTGGGKRIIIYNIMKNLYEP